MTAAATHEGSSTEHLLVAAHAWYGDVIGGSFRLASEFAQYAAENGHRVTYVCCNTTPERPAREETDGVVLRRYAPPSPRCSGLTRLWHHLAETTRLVKELAVEEGVVVLSGHSPLQFLGAARGLVGRSAHKNFVVHSPFDDELRSNVSGTSPSLAQRVAGGAAWWVDGRNVRLADCVQTDSQYTMDTMIRKHGSAVRHKGIVAPGWVDCERFQPVVDRPVTRQTLGEDWDTDLPVFFTLRRLETRMGLDTLVEAAARLAGQGAQFRLLIGGSGSLKESLTQSIQNAGLHDHVRLLGRIPEEQLATCYAAADCFVLPTKSLECFGLIVLEAFAVDTPVIASRVAAIPEVAARQGADWMFEPGNAEELATKMKHFLRGELQVTVDLRSIALEYDRNDVLRRWTEISLGGVSQPQLTP